MPQRPLAEVSPRRLWRTCQTPSNQMPSKRYDDLRVMHSFEAMQAGWDVRVGAVPRTRVVQQAQDAPAGCVR
jgi:hypothetical protein